MSETDTSETPETTETTETPVKAGRKRFTVRETCEFYGADFSKATELTSADRFELINRHYDAQALLRKQAQLERMKNRIRDLERSMTTLSKSKAKLDKLLDMIK